MIGPAIRKLLECGRLLHELSRAQARWEIDAAAHILSRRRKILIAALIPVLAVVLLQAAQAAGLLPEKIPTLGGSKAFTPAFVNSRMFLGSILVGLIAGLTTGVIGAGGGYILTPALMSFGVRGIMAVGTDQFHLFAKAIIGASIHRKLGNVNLGLAAWFVLGSVFGATIGGKVNRAILLHSPTASDAFISSVYVLVLGVLGVYAVSDWMHQRKSSTVDIAAHRSTELNAAASADENTAREATTAFAKRLQSVRLAPRIRFDLDIVEGGRSISVYPVIFCGLVVGFAAAIMGVGGGFLTFPMFVYGLGVSTFTTVGTDILQIVFTTAYSSIFQYAIYGFVFYTVAIGMLLGSLVGVQIGAMVTRMVKGSLIRMLYALTILAGFSNRLCALPRKLADLGYLSLTRDTTRAIELAGTVIFFAIVGVFAAWIFIIFLRNVNAIRAEEARIHGAGARLVIRPARFRFGVAALAAFLFLIGIGHNYRINSRPVFLLVDDMFNRLTKRSAYTIPRARDRAKRFVGTSVDFGVKPRDVWEEDKAIALLRANGFHANPTSGGRVRITADLGGLARAALDDAELAFRNRTDALQARYKMTGEEVVYYWWAVFDSLTRRYVQENRGREAEFTRLMVTRVLEPSYNFLGIPAQDIRQAAVPAAVLLVLYVLFTVWYGSAIMLLFEGLGISAAAIGEKLER